MVLTHGLTVRPFSTAFWASSAAPSITDGLEVLVHEVIEAIVTAPWSISVSVPSSTSAVGGRARRYGRLGRAARAVAAVTDTGSEAGNVSSTPSSAALELVARVT